MLAFFALVIYRVPTSSLLVRKICKVPTFLPWESAIYILITSLKQELSAVRGAYCAAVRQRALILQNRGNKQYAQEKSLNR